MSSHDFAAAEIPDPEFRIRLPQTAPRFRDTCHWMITGIADPRRWDFLAYETQVVSRRHDLRVSELPERFVLLEMIPNVTRGRGHLRGPNKYIVWAWDRAKREWVEIASCLAESWEWSLELRPVIEHALSAGEGPRVVDVRAGAARVMDAVDRELRGIGGPERIPLLATVYEGVAVRIAAEG
jgi:hypothetical protein